MKIKILRAALIGVVMSLSSLAFAQAIDDTIDLRAMYCLKAVRGDISDLTPVLQSMPIDTQGDLRKLLTNLRDDESRLSAYLLPRTKTVDPSALLLAAGRADQDRQRSKENMAACAASYSTQCKNAQTPDQLMECHRACMHVDEAGERLRSCKDTAWLPF